MSTLPWHGKMQNTHHWRMTVSQIEAEKWHTGQLYVDLRSFLKLSISNLLIFAFVCTWEHFLLSFVAEFTSCPKQCRSLFQLMLSCSWYIVSLWVFFWWDECSAFYHTQTEFVSLIIPHSPSHSQPKTRAKHSCWLPGNNQDSFWLDKLTLPTMLFTWLLFSPLLCFISCTVVAQAFSQD